MFTQINIININNNEIIKSYTLKRSYEKKIQHYTNL